LKKPPGEGTGPPIHADWVLAWDPQAGEQLAALTVFQRAAARSVIETIPFSEDRRATLMAVVK